MSIQLMGAIVDNNGQVQVVADLTQIANLPSLSTGPCVECDGIRFAVGYENPRPGTICCRDAIVSLFAYGANQQIVAQEVGVVLANTTNEEWHMSAASQYSASGQRSPRFAFTYMLDRSTGSPSVEAASYDALAPGGANTRNSGNGLLAMSLSGSPAIGQSFGFTVATNSLAAGASAASRSPTRSTLRCSEPRMVAATPTRGWTRVRRKTLERPEDFLRVRRCWGCTA